MSPEEQISGCDPRVRPHVVCPACRGELQDVPAALRCARCALDYPVVAGVPHLIPEAARRVDRSGRRR